MIKQIFFDLDGVLIDLCDTHYECFKEAVLTYSSMVVTKEQHNKELNGLPTKTKLRRLGFDDSDISLISDEKQSLTKKAMEKITIDHDLIDTLNQLNRDGIKLYCVSNSVSETVEEALRKLGIKVFFNAYVGNDSISGVNARHKPYPDVYWYSMVAAGALPEESLIIEDSEIGLTAARRSGANVMAVKNRSEVTLENIEKEMAKYTIPLEMNILIPAAGMGSRFIQAGYDRPKPFIIINGKQMISHVIDSIGIENTEYGKIRYTFIMQHTDDAHTFSSVWHRGHKIIYTNKVTDGAACTTLIAKDIIDNDLPLLICNSDQIFSWDRESFFTQMQRGNYDAGILVFNASETKWSFAKVDPRDRMTVTEVAEKKVISDLATVGAYYWKRGSDYVKYAERMIQKNIRVNNEFYVCPVFNEAIQDNRRVLAFKVNEMWGLGTPEDLNLYLEHLKEHPCESF